MLESNHQHERIVEQPAFLAVNAAPALFNKLALCCGFYPCRKTLRLYFSCLADAAVAAVDGQASPDCEAGRQPPLEVLQQAAAYISSMPQSASKAWDGCDKLAR